MARTCITVADLGCYLLLDCYITWPSPGQVSATSGNICAEIPRQVPDRQGKIEVEIPGRQAGQYLFIYMYLFVISGKIEF